MPIFTTIVEESALRGALIAISLERKLAGLRGGGCRVGILCSEKTSDRGFFVGDITRGTHRYRH